MANDELFDKLLFSIFDDIPDSEMDNIDVIINEHINKIESAINLDKFNKDIASSYFI